MNNTEVLTWIKTHLSESIRRAIQMHPGTFVTEEILAGLICRESGDLISRYAPQFPDPLTVAKYMKGDYTQRVHDGMKKYHGFGFTQIDIDSFPWFISSNAWQDPAKCFSQTIAILEGNREHILSHNPLLKGSANLIHYCVAAYNNGAGNEDKVITKQLDVDAFTTGKDYSRRVFEFAGIYLTL
jgi:hypothetical protein